MTTTITKWGNSKGIRLPKAILESLGLKENDTVELSVIDNVIMIKKPYKHKALKQRVEEFYGKDFETALEENPYEFDEIPWSGPVGDEAW
jgi:antitoxin MazE